MRDLAGGKFHKLMSRYTQNILTCLLLIACKEAAVKSTSSPAGMPNSLYFPTPAIYARKCYSELGAVLLDHPLDCRQGKLIPASANCHFESGKCSYSTFKRLDLHRSGIVAEEVQAAFLCRGTAKESYDVLGIIAHNSLTGKTCFFEAVGEESTGVISPPHLDDKPFQEDPSEISHNTFVNTDSPGKASKALRWRSLAGNDPGSPRCTMCHDSGPWLGNRRILQLEDLPRDRRFRIDAPKSEIPYHIVGESEFGWPTLSFIDIAPPNRNVSCTACHRIGTSKTCSEFLAAEVGANVSSTGEKELVFRKNEWPAEFSMPPILLSGNFPGGFEAWHDKYGEHIKELFRCCSARKKPSGCVHYRFDRESGEIRIIP